MLQVEYKHDIQKNYLVIKGEEKGNYMLHMLAGKKVQGFLPLEIREFNNQKEYYYDITGKESLAQRSNQGKWKVIPIKKYISQILTEIGKCKEYLLNSDNLVLDPAYIYIDVQSGEVALCYVHYYDTNINEQLIQLFSYFMNGLDYQDKEAVQIVYSLYETSRKKHCTLNDLWKIISMETNKTTIEKIEPEEMPQKNLPKLQRNKKSLISGEKNNRRMGGASNRKGEKKEETLPKKEEKKRIGNAQIKIGKAKKKRSTAENLKLIVVLQVAFLLLLAVAAKNGIFCNEQGISVIRTVMGLFVIGVLDLLILGRIFAAEKEEIKEINESVVRNPFVNLNDNAPSMLIKEPSIKERKKPFTLEEQKEADETLKVKNMGDNTVILDYDKTVIQGTEPSIHKKQCYLIPEERGQEIISLGEFPFFIGRFQKDTESLEKRKNISRMHSKIEQMGEQFFITDLNSTNGTFVNEQRIERNQKIELTEGDKISFADIPFYFTREWKVS